MIVDDSMVARAVLSRMVEADGGFEIAAVAGTAEDAIDALAHVRVDVVLLDLEMPGAGGLRMLPQIIAAARGARIIVVSSLAEEGAEATVAALAMGAADTMPKPGIGRFNGQFSRVLLGKLRALGYAGEAAVASESQPSASIVPLCAMSSAPLSVLAIGASTGGIHALGQFFKALPLQMGVPILVTQHLPSPFMDVFARQLAVAASRTAVIAQDGMDLLNDRIHIAPGFAHLTVEEQRGGGVIRLDHRRAASGCLPSVDPMLSSAANVFRTGACAVILSGMGRDGVDGAARLVSLGGSVLAQDKSSSAVWGMPRAVAEAGLACAILPPDKLARRVASRAGETAWK